MFATLARLMANRSIAWVTVIVVLLVAVISLALAGKIEHEDDLLAFLPRDNAEVRAFYDINKRFGGLDIALVGIEGDVLGKGFLERLRRVTRDLRETRGLNGVLSLANVLDFAPDKERGGIVAGRLVEPTPTTPAEQAALEARVMSRDLVVGNLISADGRAALIYCFLAFGTEVKSVSAQIKRVVDGGFPQEKKYWGGNPFISSYIYLTTQEDLRRLTPWAGLAIVLIMMIAFRDVIATLLALLSTGIGIVISLGLMAALGVKFNIVLGSMPIIMLALGSAYAIHVLARYYSLSQECDVETAVARTITGVGPTVLAAGLTTSISLLSFVFMDIQPMRIFGLFTAIGLTIKLVLSLTFIPAVVRLLNVKRKPSSQLALRGALRRVAVFAQTRRVPVALALGLIAGAGATFALRVDARLDQSAFFSPGSPPDEAERYMRRRFGGSQFVQLHVRGDMTEPAVLREVQRMADELALLPGVSSVMHVAQAVAQVNEAMTGQRRVPDTAAQVKLLYTFVLGDPSVAQLGTTDRAEALLQVKLTSSRAAEQETQLGAIEAWARRQDLATSVLVGRGGVHQAAATARVRRVVLARLRAAAHQARRPFADEALGRVERGLTAAPVAPRPAPVAAALQRFLRSEECVVQLPPASGDDDPARRLATAIAALGPTPSNATLAAAAAAVLGRPPGDATVQDLVTGVTTPLSEMWSAELASARATELVRVAGLTLPAGPAGPRLHSAFAAALLDLDAPTTLVPGLGAAAGAGEPRPLALQVSGLPVMNRGLSQSVFANQLKSLAFALVVVLLIMILLFRSLRSGLLGVTPALFTLLAIYGGMGLLGVRLDIGTSMLASIIVGAGVDYAIHLIAGWRAPAGGSLADAAATGADRSGLAVWTNAVMIAAGFFVLTLGEARPLKNVGGLVAAAMLVAALATYLAIPALARRPWYRRASDEQLAETALVPPAHSPVDR